jgi:hypothetical protein
MDTFNILKNEKYNVGNIQKQRINITTKTKGVPLKQKDIKKIIKLINEKGLRKDLINNYGKATKLL